MTENEQIFWNRVLELAQSQLKQATFDFFVSDAKLLKVEGNIATILLDDMKKLFWEKNLQPVVLTAGFEVFNTEISIEYVFEETQSTSNSPQISQNKTAELATETLPFVQNDLNPKYSFDNFVIGDENRWAFTASVSVADLPGQQIH